MVVMLFELIDFIFIYQIDWKTVSSSFIGKYFNELQPMRFLVLSIISLLILVFNNQFSNTLNLFYFLTGYNLFFEINL
jgi:hypothetical protein